MNSKKLTNQANRTLLLAIAFGIFVLHTSAAGQSPQKLQSIPPPSAEKFESAFGRIRESIGLSNRFTQDRKETDTIRIYNANGSLWYEFSYYESSPIFYKKIPREDFRPIGPLPMNGMSNFGIMLKLKAESENWYEVVVNEETQATEYTWKGDVILGRDTWESYIPQCVFITFEKEKNPLRESPNGKVSSMQMPTAQKFFRAGILESDLRGDWLYVSTGRSKYVEEPIDGWIRWKKGNELLIGFWVYEKEKVNENESSDDEVY